MSNIVQERIRECLADFLQAFPLVNSFYLFGSQVDGKADQDSDVDLAVFLQSVTSVSPLLELEMECWWQERLHCEVDVVLMNKANPVLRHEVLDKGVRLFERDSALRARQELIAFKDYLDLCHYQEKRRRWRAHG